MSEAELKAAIAYHLSDLELLGSELRYATLADVPAEEWPVGIRVRVRNAQSDAWVRARFISFVDGRSPAPRYFALAHGDLTPTVWAICEMVRP